jgi:single-stranded-DNA-specific exonuclease
LLGCEVAESLTPSNSATKQLSNQTRVLILSGEHWHRGVIGLTAGRIAQKFHRPTLVISIDGDQAAGSARSISTINLHDQLEAVSDLFAHFGGHDFACGFSLHPTNIPELRRRLNEQFDSLDEAAFRHDASVDAELTLSEVDRAFVDAHEMLQPFGAGNPQPLFLARDVAIAARRTFGENCVELTLEDTSGRAVAVVWPSVQTLNGTLSAKARVDVLFHVEPDSYASAGVRLSIADARNSAAA